MSYATPADFVAYFGEQESIELTHLDDPTAGSVDAVLLQKALDHATSEINAYLTGNYSLPLTSVPPILMYDCCEIARFRLDRYRTREDVQDRYDKVIQRLRDIAKGLVNLGLDQNNQEVASGATSEPAYVSCPPVFTAESLWGF